MVKNSNLSEKKVALKGAAVLMMLSLRSQQRVEIFCEGRFWKAVVTVVEDKGFRFRYSGTNEFGRVLFRDLHSSWRFPLGCRSKHYTAESILLMI